MVHSPCWSWQPLVLWEGKKINFILVYQSQLSKRYSVIKNWISQKMSFALVKQLSLHVRER